MRQRSQKQMYLRNQSASTRTSDELAKMEEILSALPEYEKLLDMVLADLNTPSNSSEEQECTKEQAMKPCSSALSSPRGRKGMSADQVLKAFLVKHYKDCSYRELEELSKDSFCIGKFLEIDPHGEGISYKCLQGNIKKLSEETVDFFLVRLSSMPKTKALKKVLKHARMQPQ